MIGNVEYEGKPLCQDSWSGISALRVTRVLCLVVVFLPALVTAVSYVRRWCVHPRDPDAEPLPFTVRAVAFLGECLASTALILTWPFGWWRPARRGDGNGRRMIVLVPGLLLNRAALWPLRRRFERTGWSVVICASPPWRASLDGRAHGLARCLADATARHSSVTVVAFGRGGEVARHLLRRHPHAGIDRLVTLGTLHQRAAPGAGRWARTAPAVPEDRLPYEMEVVAIYSDLDAVVPTAYAYYPGAFNIEVRGVGHVSLLTSRRVFELLAENVAPADGAHA